MPFVPLSLATYDDTSYGQAPIRLENWFAEPAPDRPQRAGRLLPTPGLTSFSAGLNGAVRGLFQVDGLLSGNAVAAAGERIYRVSSAGTATEVGTITGTDEVRFAASQSDLVAAAGGTAYVVTSSLSAVSIPSASGSITDVAEYAQRHLFLEDGSGRVHISDTADPTAVTQFVTAESEPDNLLALAVYGSTILFLGTQTVEGWYYTGSKDQPFAARPEYKVSKGLLARGAMVQADFGVFWLSDDGVVWSFNGATPSRVSTFSLERVIQNVTLANRSSIRLSAHNWDGHQFIGLHLPGVGDYYYDNSARFWHRRRTGQTSSHLARHYFSAWGGVYAGSYLDGTIYRLDRDVYTEAGEEVTRVANAILPVADGRPSVSSLTVEMVPGVGLISGQGSDPVVMMRHSRNGREWSDEVRSTFGKMGEYDWRCVFGSLGRFHPPFGMIEISVSDPVPAVVSGLGVNMSRP